MVHLTVAPISGDIQGFHHVTQIGGNIAIPVPHEIGLSGFGSNPIPARLAQDIFDDLNDVVVSSWASLIKLSKASEVVVRSNAKGATVSFRNLILTPPLLHIVKLD